MMGSRSGSQMHAACRQNGLFSGSTWVQQEVGEQQMDIVKPTININPTGQDIQRVSNRQRPAGSHRRGLLRAGPCSDCNYGVSLRAATRTRTIGVLPCVNRKRHILVTNDDKSSTTAPSVKINSIHVRQLQHHQHHRADARRGGGGFKTRPRPRRRWVQLKHLVSSNRWTARVGSTRRHTRDQILHTQKRIVSARCRLKLGSKSYLVLLRFVILYFAGVWGGGVQVGLVW